MKKSDRHTQIYYDVNKFKPSPELKKLQHLMPISPEDRASLKKDIQDTKVVRDALKVYHSKNRKHLLILCGLNRWEIVKELNEELNLNIEIPYDVYDGLTAKERRELVVNDNLNRRHLTREQKRNIIEYFLKDNPSQSNRAIAEKSGTTDKTVGKIRNEMETTAEIPQLDETTGKDGKKRPAKKSTGEISQLETAVDVGVLFPEYTETEEPADQEPIDFADYGIDIIKFLSNYPESKHDEIKGRLIEIIRLSIT